MGCCFSAGDLRAAAEPPKSPSSEEETVKEVLTETVPVPKPADGEMNQDRKMDAGSTAEIRRDSAGKGNEESEIGCEVSEEASEICSYGESYSNNALPPPPPVDGKDGVVNQKPPPPRKRRFPSGGRGGGQGRSLGVGAAAPEKRGQVAPLRSVRGKRAASQPRSVAQEIERERDAREGSGGRSRSPARRDASEEKVPLPERATDIVPADEAESLENPIVSLECFIFL